MKATRAVPLSVLLSLLAGVTSLPAQAEPFPEYAPEYAAIERDELVEERSVFTKSFANEDGTTTIQLGSAPIHYQPPGAPDVYLPIDTTLQPDDGWRNETNSFPVHLPPALGDGRAIVFGAELGIRWIPGTLNAVLVTGEVEALAEPEIAEGIWSDEDPSTVTYSGLYPGLDLVVSVRAGGLAIEVEGALDFPGLEPEEVDAWRIDAILEAEGFLLEALEERLAEGEPAELVPLYFGRREDELVLSFEPGSLMGPEMLATLRELDEPWEPGEDEPVYLRIPDEASEVPASPTGDLGDAALPVSGVDTGAPLALEPIDLDRGLAAGLRSAYSIWREQGRLHSYFRLPPRRGGAVPSAGSRTSALTVGLSYQRVLRRSFFFQPGTGPFTLTYDEGCLPPCVTNRYGYLAGTMWAGNFADIWHYRAVVPIKGILDLKQHIDPKRGKTIKAMFLGYRETKSIFDTPGVSAEDPDYIVASDVGWRLYGNEDSVKTGGSYRWLYWMVFKQWPYTLTARHLPDNKSAAVGTWGEKPVKKIVDGKQYTFGAMSSAAYGGSPGSPTVTYFAHDRMMRALDRDMAYWLVGLHQPYESRRCVPCTQNHWSPSLDKSSGKMYIGAGFEDIRLEVVVEESTAKTAQIEVTTGGSSSLSRDLYPGETLTYDLQLKGGSGFQWVDVLVHDSDLPQGMSVSFYPGGSSTPSSSWPRFRVTGDKARVALSWSGTATTVPKPFDLDLYGRFDDRYPGGVFQSIRIRPRVPRGAVTVTPAPGTTPSMPDTMYEDLFRAVSLNQGSLRGAEGALLRLSLPGRKPQLVRGRHYTLHPAWVSPGHPGRIYVHPQRLAETYGGGRLEFQLEVCLRSRRLSQMACLKPIPLNLDLASQAIGWPFITRIDPWNADQAGVAATRVGGKIVGGSLVAATGTPRVEISGAPFAGPLVKSAGAVTTSSTTRVSADWTLPGNVQCGAYDVRLERSSGVVADSTFNLTKPFRSAAAHVVLEAESAQQRVFQGTTSHRAASHGEAVSLVRGGTWLLAPFRVPKTSTYRLFLRAHLTAASVPVRVRLNRVNPDDTRTQVSNVPTALRHPSSNFRINPIYRTAASPARADFTLTAGELYEVEILNVSASRLLVDMIILSDGTKMPLQSEICSN